MPMVTGFFTPTKIKPKSTEAPSFRRSLQSEKYRGGSKTNGSIGVENNGCFITTRQRVST